MRHAKLLGFIIQDNFSVDMYVNYASCRRASENTLNRAYCFFRLLYMLYMHGVSPI